MNNEKAQILTHMVQLSMFLGMKILITENSNDLDYKLGSATLAEIVNICQGRSSPTVVNPFANTRPESRFAITILKDNVRLHSKTVSEDRKRDMVLFSASSHALLLKYVRGTPVSPQQWKTLVRSWQHWGEPLIPSKGSFQASAWCALMETVLEMPWRDLCTYVTSLPDVRRGSNLSCLQVLCMTNKLKTAMKLCENQLISQVIRTDEWRSLLGLLHKAHQSAQFYTNVWDDSPLFISDHLPSVVGRNLQPPRIVVDGEYICRGFVMSTMGLPPDFVNNLDVNTNTQNCNGALASDFIEQIVQHELFGELMRITAPVLQLRPDLTQHPNSALSNFVIQSNIKKQILCSSFEQWKKKYEHVFKAKDKVATTLQQSCWQIVLPQQQKVQPQKDRSSIRSTEEQKLVLKLRNNVVSYAEDEEQFKEAVELGPFWQLQGQFGYQRRLLRLYCNPYTWGSVDLPTVSSLMQF
jgi:hypothetical protein